MMVKEKAVSQVQRGNFLHLLSRQLEIEQIKIFLHTLPPHRLRNDDSADL